MSPTSREARLGTRGAAIAVALVLGVAGGLAACNFIVGAGSYSVGSGDAGMSDTGTVFDTGPIVDSGSHADVTKPMDSGAGGDGMAEGGVSCGMGLPTTSMAFKQALTTCVLAESCDPYAFQVSISDCMTEDYLHSIGTYACLTTISDCAGYTSCTGESIANSTQCPGATQPSCDSNNNAVQCNPTGGGAVRNCTKLGGTCGTYTDDGGVITADCVAVTSCPQPNDGNDYCSGSSLYTCIGGKGYGENCTLIEATCLDGGGGNGSGCYFNGPACTTPGYTCNSNVVDWCTTQDITLAYNCSTAGLKCTPNADGTGTAQCLAPGCTSTDIASCTESCTGTFAQVCVGGAPYAFDCSKIAGFTTCATFTDNTSLNVRAYCQ
jgi:hypothetical protein